MKIASASDNWKFDRLDLASTEHVFFFFAMT